MSLLESAGFSRSNPYYIVPQGRVRLSLSTWQTSRKRASEPDADAPGRPARRSRSSRTRRTPTASRSSRRSRAPRCTRSGAQSRTRSWTRRVRRTRPRSCSLRCRRAGANVGSCRTDSKRDKIKDLLDYIQERLDELEEEKEELKQFQVRPCSTLSAPCPDVPDGLLPPADARPLAPLARVLHLPARAAGRRRHARPDRGGAPARRRQRQLEAGGVQRAREGAVGASPSASSTSIPTRSAPADSLLRAQTLAARLSTLRESLSTLSTEHRELRPSRASSAPSPTPRTPRGRAPSAARAPRRRSSASRATSRPRRASSPRCCPTGRARARTRRRRRTRSSRPR